MPQIGETSADYIPILEYVNGDARNTCDEPKPPRFDGQPASVRAGTLSREDAKQIFNTAVLGAEAQGFKPTGNRPSLVHESSMDFLGEAEAVYFARKQLDWATRKGGYQLSGGRVFPTKHNSGLNGLALRKEQEDFFERQLRAGRLPDSLRGQAHEAGVARTKKNELGDPDVEAALQRAMKKVDGEKKGEH